MNKEMNKEIINNKETRDLTAAVFRVTEDFDGGEILKQKIQRKALDIFAKSNPHFDSIAVKDIGVLKNFLKLAQDMNLTKAINCDVLILEYDRLLDGINKNIINDRPILVNRVEKDKSAPARNPQIQTVPLTNRQKKILKLFKNKSNLRLKEIGAIFPDLTSRTLRSDLRGLSKNGYLIRSGLGAGSVYKLKS